MKPDSTHTQNFSAPIQTYLRAVSRRLDMPKEIRERVISDLATAIRARIEQGESEETILASLDTPTKAAADFNTQMKDFTYRKSPWRFVFLTLAVLGVLWLIGSLLVPQLIFREFSFKEASTIGIIGGADGPTSIFITSSPQDLAKEAAVCLLLIAAGIFGYIKMKKLKK